jgi:hypothetical protein
MVGHHSGGAGIIQVPQIPTAFKRGIDGLTIISFPAKLQYQLSCDMVPAGKKAKGTLQGFGMRWLSRTGRLRSVFIVHYRYTFTSTDNLLTDI